MQLIAALTGTLSWPTGRGLDADAEAVFAVSAAMVVLVSDRSRHLYPQGYERHVLTDKLGRYAEESQTPRSGTPLSRLRQDLVELFRVQQHDKPARRPRLEEAKACLLGTDATGRDTDMRGDDIDGQAVTTPCGATGPGRPGHQDLGRAAAGVHQPASDVEFAAPRSQSPPQDCCRPQEAVRSALQNASPTPEPMPRQTVCGEGDASASCSRSREAQRGSHV